MNNFEEMMQMGDNPENMHLAEKNLMQFILAEKHGETLYEFAERHAKDLNDLIESNPEILDKFKNNPEETLENVESTLYH